MAERRNEIHPSVEAYRNLLDFNYYHEYLDSLITEVDIRNLQKTSVARTIASNGFRRNGETLNREEFYKRRAAIYAVDFPKPKENIVSSAGADLSDKLAMELAIREQPNRTGILSTIIFIRVRNKRGSEVSGYIDYGHRLMTQNWKYFFRGKKLLEPKISDLGYYHWRHGTVRNNVSRNFIPILDARNGLLFLNRQDHKIIYPDPQRSSPGENTVRLRVNSPNCLQCELFDHIVRKKC